MFIGGDRVSEQDRGRVLGAHEKAEPRVRLGVRC